MSAERVETREEHARALAEYAEAGAARAAKLGNRGPVAFGSDGALAPEIRQAYAEHGFYVFEGLIDPVEVDELRTDVDFLLEHAPTKPGGDVDAQGRPAFGSDFLIPPYFFVKPLSDPFGGTDALKGRHPTKMVEPRPEAGAPEAVIQNLSGLCQTMPSALRLYGHPHLLEIARSILGDDFVPYTEVAFVKQPGLGGSVSWHQDGMTHWDAPNWTPEIHGFNFQVQLYTCTPQNSLWVVPGSHHRGRIDIERIVAENDGCERIPEAIPLCCEPGDVTLVNRQILHGSFANSSPDLRVSLTYGFYPRGSVLGVSSAAGPDRVYDEAHIEERSSVIQVGIDARAQHFPNEKPFPYRPFAGREDRYRFDPETWERVVRNYNLKDIYI